MTTGDTRKLRQEFINEFMWMTDADIDELTMDDILDLFDQELGAAKRKYGPHFNADAQYNDGLDWLAERDFWIEEAA